jgi:hypothetical protein
MFVTMNTALTLNADLRTGIFDRFRSLPIARSAPLTGHVLGDLVKYMLSLALVFGFGAALGFRTHGSPLAVLAGCGLIMLFSFAVCWISALVGMLAKSPGSVQGFAFMLIFPLTFASNVFVPHRGASRLAAGLGETQPGDAGVRRRARADAGPAAGPHAHRVAAMDRGHPRAVRATGGTGLPPAGLIRDQQRHGRVHWEVVDQRSPQRTWPTCAGSNGRRSARRRRSSPARRRIVPSSTRWLPAAPRASSWS